MTFEQWFDKNFPIQYRNFGSNAGLHVVKEQYRQVWEAAQLAVKEDVKSQ